MSKNITDAIDNWMTADMFRRQAESILYERMRRQAPLTVEESNAAYDAFKSSIAHFEQAIEKMGD